MMGHLTLGVSNLEKGSAFFGACAHNPDGNPLAVYPFS